jgi:hypothetical protein
MASSEVKSFVRSERFQEIRGDFWERFFEVRDVTEGIFELLREGLFHVVDIVSECFVSESHWLLDRRKIVKSREVVIKDGLKFYEAIWAFSLGHLGRFTSLA